MKKKLAVLLCASMLGTALTACGSNSSSDQTASSSTEESKWASTEETFDPLTVEDAVTFEELRESNGAITKSSDE